MGITNNSWRRKYTFIGKDKIAYLDMGKGETVICIPSWPAPASVFIPLYKALTKDIRLIAVDLPGWFGYSKSKDRSSDLGFYKDMLIRFVKKIKPNRINLLGFSMGGMIAQLVTGSNALKVNKTIIISSPNDMGLVYKSHMAGLNLYKTIRNLRISDKLKISIFRAVVWKNIKNESRTIISKTPTIISDFKNGIRYLKINEIFEMIIKHRDFRIDIDRLKRRKILVIYGDNEPEYIIKGGEEFNRNKEIKTVVLNGLNHEHLITNADESAREIEAFMNI